MRTVRLDADIVKVALVSKERCCKLLYSLSIGYTKVQGEEERKSTKKYLRNGVSALTKARAMD